MSRFSENSISHDRRGIPGLPGYMILLGNHPLKKDKGAQKSYTITHATPLTQIEMYELKLNLANKGVTKIVEFYRLSDGTRYAIECRYTHDTKNIKGRKYTNPNAALYTAFSGNFVDSAIQHKSDELRDSKYLTVELYTIRFIEGVGLVLEEKDYTEIDGGSDPGVIEDKGAMGVVVKVDKLIHALQKRRMISQPEGKPNGKRKLEEQAPVPELLEDEIDDHIYRADSAKRIYSEEIKQTMKLQEKFDAFKEFYSVLYGKGDNHIAKIVSTYLQHKTILDAELKSMLGPKIDEMQNILEGKQPQDRIYTLLQEIDEIFRPRFTQLLTDIQTLSKYHPKLKKHFPVDIKDLTKPEQALSMLHQHSASAKFDTTEELARLNAGLYDNDDEFEGGSRTKQKKKTRKRNKKQIKRNKSKRHKGYSRR